MNVGISGTWIFCPKRLGGASSAELGAEIPQPFDTEQPPEGTSAKSSVMGVILFIVMVVLLLAICSSSGVDSVLARTGSQ